MSKMHQGRRVLRFMSFIGVLSLFTVATVQAQASVDPTSLEVVVQALEKTRAASSLHIETQNQTEITLIPGMSLGQQGASSFDLTQGTEGWNATGSQTTTLTLPTGESEFTTETIILDGGVYLRFDGTPGIPGQALTEAQALPEGWFDVAKLAEDQQLSGNIVNNDSEASV
ncbi:MAG: hypothetical protein H7X77_05240, partial [Anaerolineae bacterium]|nr:hypothetical protein [Anaerolineae bacterium]